MRVFERPVAKRDPLYSVFGICEFCLGLFAYRQVGEQPAYAWNAEQGGMLERMLRGLERAEGEKEPGDGG